MAKKKHSKSNKRSFFDKHHDLQTILIGLTIVMFWRGSWGLLDIYLFPDDLSLSFISSFLAGLLLLFILNHHKLKNLG